MSSNRLIYDTCAYSTKLDESVGPLAYVLNPLKYENCKKCRHELGLVGGSAVSHIKGNLVDLENDLRGSTRLNSQCPSNKYYPSNNQSINIKSKCPCGCGKNVEVDTRLEHLPSCQMIHYKDIPEEPKLNLDSCPPPQIKNISVNTCSCGKQLN